MAAIRTGNVLKRLALLAAGLLLFGQLALSAQACMSWMQPGPAQGLDGANYACAGAPMAKGTCSTHCLEVMQPANPSADHYFHSIPAPVSHVAGFSALRRANSSASHSPGTRPSSGPSLQILFCSFQT